MSFAIVPAAEVPLAEQALVANRAFANYVAGWADLDATGLARFLSLQGADLLSSRFVSVDGKLAGFGYLNRTGNIPRLAGMALEPAARGTGASAYLLRHLCEESSLRGEPAMILEVIEQNPRAHAFYQREGFRNLGRLCGWRGAGNEHPQQKAYAVEEIPILDALRMPAARDYPDLPWPITRYAAAKQFDVRAYRAPRACVFIIDSGEVAPIRVHSLLSADGNWLEQRNALAGVLRLFPGREFFTPAVFPEEFGDEIFAPLGFRREALSQFLMRRDF